jgi:hypothetical protein
MNNLPLWMVEGMQNIFPLGDVDANTSMWMRDALIHKKFPSIKRFKQHFEYFPYRYGQALWHS